MLPYSVEQSILEGDTEVKALFQYVEDNAMNFDAYEIEDGIKNRLNRIGLAALKSYFAHKGTGNEGDFIKTEDGTILKKEKELRDRTYFSTFGKLKIPRTCYRIKGKPGMMPLDVQVNLPDKSYSYLLQEYMDLLGIQDPFEKSSEILEKFLGFKIHCRPLESVSQASCLSYDQFYKANTPPEPETEGAISVVGFDGVGVPLIKKEATKIIARMGKGEKRLKKKEALVGVGYTIDPNVRTPEQVAQNLVYPEKNKDHANDSKQKPRAKNIHRMASLERPKKEVVHEIMSLSRSRDPDNKKLLIVIMDGALSLWSIVIAYLCLKPFTGILDIIHVVEYLWKVANALYGESNLLGKKWVHDNLLMILQGRVDSVIGRLDWMLEEMKLKKSKRAALYECSRYLKNHRKWMRYDKYLLAGYPIGSGVVESSCGHTVKDRMEGTGRRWSIEGAESILQLRSVYTSGDWDEYWKFHMKLERSYYYHDLMICLGMHDDFNELGDIEKNYEINILAA